MNQYNRCQATSLLSPVQTSQGYHRGFQWVVSLLLLLTLLTSCTLPQVSAEERIFFNFSLDYLGEYKLPQVSESNPNFIHLSAITYERSGYSENTTPGIHFYALAENIPELYHLKFDFTSAENLTLNPVKIENTIRLKDQSNQPLSSTTTVPESLVFSPRNSVFIALDNITENQTTPLIGEFDLTTGEQKNTVPLPPGYLPIFEEGKQQQGIQPNLGFQSMTIAPDGLSPGGKDPFRLFITTAAPLVQDTDINTATKLRILHYVIADRASFLVSENLYPLEASETSSHELADIVALSQGGYFLSLERSPSSSQIYQVFTGDATDTSRIVSLRGELRKVQPMRKKLLLDLKEVGIPINHLSSMTLGPRLTDGSQSLLLLGENDSETPQFWLFSLKQS